MYKFFTLRQTWIIEQGSTPDSYVPVYWTRIYPLALAVFYWRFLFCRTPPTTLLMLHNIEAK